MGASPGGPGTWLLGGEAGAAPGRVAAPLTAGQRLLRDRGVLVFEPVQELVQGGLQGLRGLGAVELSLQPLRLQLLLGLTHRGGTVRSAGDPTFCP